MIEALAALGRYSEAQWGSIDESNLRTLIDNPASTPRYKHVLLITFDSANDCRFVQVEYEEYSKEKINEYLYKKGAPNGPDVTPTAQAVTCMVIRRCIGLLSGGLLL